MTYKELTEEVAGLGFESEIGEASILLNAANRAVRQIFNERPVYQTLEIYQTAKIPASRIESHRHIGSTNDIFEFNAKAYSFKTSGEGVYTVTDALGSKTVTFTESESYHRGFVHGEGQLEFSGEYSHGVYDLCFFDEIFGEGVDKIPVFDQMCEYRVSELVPHFLSAAGEPKDSDGKVIDGAVMLGGVLKLPYRFDGKASIVYKRSAEPIKESSAEIILPDGCEHLLPLLTASYVWLDDDPEKAQYYLSLYREGMSSLKYYHRERVAAGYRNVTGWA